ncbi:MAG: hypothetical protein AB1589_41740 [Cyanobacteriota bacterium]
MVISAERPFNGSGYPPNVHIRKRVPLDGGNRFLKYFDSLSRVQILPSVVKELEDWEEFGAPNSLPTASMEPHINDWRIVDGGDRLLCLVPLPSP